MTPSEGEVTARKLSKAYYSLVGKCTANFHRHSFLKGCIRFQIIPPTLRVQPPPAFTNRCFAPATAASRSYLQKAIRQCAFQLLELRKQAAAAGRKLRRLPSQHPSTTAFVTAAFHTADRIRASAHRELSTKYRHKTDHLCRTRTAPFIHKRLPTDLSTLPGYLPVTNRPTTQTTPPTNLCTPPGVSTGTSRARLAATTRDQPGQIPIDRSVFPTTGASASATALPASAVRQASTSVLRPDWADPPTSSARASNPGSPPPVTPLIQQIVPPAVSNGSTLSPSVPSVTQVTSPVPLEMSTILPYVPPVPQPEPTVTQIVPSATQVLPQIVPAVSTVLQIVPIVPSVHRVVLPVPQSVPPVLQVIPPVGVFTPPVSSDSPSVLLVPHEISSVLPTIPQVGISVSPPVSSVSPPVSPVFPVAPSVPSVTSVPSVPSVTSVFLSSSPTTALSVSQGLPTSSSSDLQDSLTIPAPPGLIINLSSGNSPPPSISATAPPPELISNQSIFPPTTDLTRNAPYVNLTALQLTSEEHAILSLGPKATLAPRRPSKEAVIADVENAIYHLSPDHRDLARRSLFPVVSGYQPRPYSGVDRRLRRVLDGLRSRPGIRLCLDDKSDRIVVLYQMQLTSLLCDFFSAQECSRIPDDTSMRLRDKFDGR